MKFATFFAVVITAVSASNVLELNPSTFSTVVGQGKPGLVEFFAPWCGHCKKLAPVYEEVADAYAHAKEKLYIAKVDADGEGRELGQKYEVKGYPTLKWFNGDGTYEPYESGRDKDSLINFITSKTGVQSSLPPPPPPDYQIVDVHDFDSVVLDDAKDVLISFTAPWCGHCKQLKPTYNKVAADFKSEPNCLVVNIDADDAKNKDIAKKYGVSSYPTIKFFGRGKKDEPEAYVGARTEEGFVKFLNERCDTFRTVGGGLSEEAGRLPDFDTLANKFFIAATDAKGIILQEAMSLAETVGVAAKPYVHVMEKMLNSTDDYLAKEASRLEGLLKKRTLTPAKLDEIKIKSNILRAFSAPEVSEETADEDAIGKDEAEL
ncbi:disulfide isomerase [Fistulina hepatica ATCC 64428]|nr:disulfide isomerase [Fistulina hepatica ATCC 64428]